MKDVISTAEASRYRSALTTVHQLTTDLYTTISFGRDTASTLPNIVHMYLVCHHEVGLLGIDMNRIPHNIKPQMEQLIEQYDSMDCEWDILQWLNVTHQTILPEHWIVTVPMFEVNSWHGPLPKFDRNKVVTSRVKRKRNKMNKCVGRPAKKKEQ